MQKESQKQNSQTTYRSLDFLYSSNDDFQNSMVEYIRENFADLLGPEEMRLLTAGDADSLEELSRRCMARYSKKQGNA